MAPSRQSKSADEFAFVDRQWHSCLARVMGQACDEILVVSPFIQDSAVSQLITRPQVNIRVLTRFNLREFSEQVSDLNALESLLEMGTKIKGIKYLHAKLYISDLSRLVVTSANLTDAALHRNQEFGLETTNTDLISVAKRYFDDLWARGGPLLTGRRVEKWRKQINGVVSKGSRPNERRRLPDYGTDLGLHAGPVHDDHVTGPTQVSGVPQAFVKFFGTSGSRRPRQEAVLEVVKEAGCHWACTYPRNKRPRRVKDGAIMYLAHLVEKPPDIIVFGRAIGHSYVEGRDDATPGDIERRDWKEDWPHYIRVRDPAFLDGPLSNGLSLNDLMEELGSDIFATTQQNQRLGHGNVNPRRAYLRQADVELTEEAAMLMDARLNVALSKHGKINDNALQPLDWPKAER